MVSTRSVLPGDIREKTWGKGSGAGRTGARRPRAAAAAWKVTLSSPGRSLPASSTRSNRRKQSHKGRGHPPAQVAIDLGTDHGRATTPGGGQLLRICRRERQVQTCRWPAPPAASAPWPGTGCRNRSPMGGSTAGPAGARTGPPWRGSPWQVSVRPAVHETTRASTARTKSAPPRPGSTPPASTSPGRGSAARHAARAGRAGGTGPVQAEEVQEHVDENSTCQLARR